MLLGLTPLLVLLVLLQLLLLDLEALPPAPIDQQIKLSIVQSGESRACSCPKTLRELYRDRIRASGYVSYGHGGTQLLGLLAITNGMHHHRDHHQYQW